MSFPEQPLYLSQMSPHRRRAGLIIGLAIGAVVLVGAGAAGAYAAFRPASHPAAATSSSPSPTRSSDLAADPTMTAAKDQTVQAACDQLAAHQGKDVYDPDLMEPIGKQFAAASDTTFRINGLLLADRAQLARAAKGKSDEMTAVLSMGGSAIELSTACVKGGYTKP